MNESDARRYVDLNLPLRARSSPAHLRSLEALGAFGEAGNGERSRCRPLRAAGGGGAALEEDPPWSGRWPRPTTSPERARALVAAILATPARGDRLGQFVRNLFECLGLPEEGAALSLECGERPDSPLR